MISTSANHPTRSSCSGRHSLSITCGREYSGKSDPERSFIQLTINIVRHPLMRCFHKSGDEKRALVIVPQAEWDDWLDCSDPEYARGFLRPYPAELMRAWPFSVPPRVKKSESAAAQETQIDLL